MSRWTLPNMKCDYPREIWDVMAGHWSFLSIRVVFVVVINAYSSVNDWCNTVRQLADEHLITCSQVFVSEWHRGHLDSRLASWEHLGSSDESACKLRYPCPSARSAHVHGFVDGSPVDLLKLYRYPFVFITIVALYNVSATNLGEVVIEAGVYFSIVMPNRDAFTW